MLARRSPIRDDPAIRGHALHRPAGGVSHGTPLADDSMRDARRLWMERCAALRLIAECAAHAMARDARQWGVTATRARRLPSFRDETRRLAGQDAHGSLRHAVHAYVKACGPGRLAGQLVLGVEEIVWRAARQELDAEPAARLTALAKQWARDAAVFPSPPCSR